MKNLHGFPFFEMEFKKDGTIYKNEQKEALLNSISNSEITNLVVISHGWNNDKKEAEDMYDEIFRFVSDIFKERSIESKKYGVLGIYWPSKKFADKDLIPGGAAGTGELNEENERTEYLLRLKGFFDAPDADENLDKLVSFVQNPDAGYGSSQDDEIYTVLNNLLSPLLEQENFELFKDEGTKIDNPDIKDIVTALEYSDEDEMPEEGAGGAAGIGSGGSGSLAEGSAMGQSGFFGGIKDGVFNMLNLVTYYQMKNRAGIVGIHGLNGVLKEVKAKKPSIKLHLIGHSFGARLVTSAIAGENKETSQTVRSLILLQAAFSHFGFAKAYAGNKDGMFRRIVDDSNVQGPIVISHTRNDNAVGLAYALASRIARQAGSAIGDENDFYGGLGSNGAQKTPEVINTIALVNGQSYSFQDKKIYNLKADTTIEGHSFIKNKAVAQVIVDAITK